MTFVGFVVNRFDVNKLVKEICTVNSDFSKKVDKIIEEIKKEVHEALCKTNRKVVKQIEKELKQTYEHYIADYYYYSPRRYERQENLWYGLKVIKRKEGDIYTSLKFRYSSVYFPRRCKSKINPEIVMDMVLEGNRAPYWFSAVDSKNFGKHVVTYSGDNFNNQIFETRRGMVFDDMMESAMKNASKKLENYIETYFYKYWR